MDDSRKPPWTAAFMKPLRSRLMEVRSKQGLPWEVIERDYVLSLILLGISEVEPLRRALVFKGGTALKKCYFGDYRFSEDLDFSTTGVVQSGRALESAIAEACVRAKVFVDQYAPVEIYSERYEEKEPHPRGQEAFKISAQLPWQRTPTANVLIEITTDEKILLPVSVRNVIHEYGEPLDAEIPVYALEEIIAEKLRAILQYGDQLERRGWARSRSRDYYDLWRVFGTYRRHLDLAEFVALLNEKCAVRKVAFKGYEDFFNPKVLAHVEDTWQQWLGRVVPDLPPYASVMSDLRRELSSLIPAD
jgi:uncharacterized protein